MAKRKKTKTIKQYAELKRFLLLRARRDLTEAIYCDEQIEKMRTGKIKSPAPKGVKVKLSSADKVRADEFGDVLPTFGGNPAGGFE